jgi:nitrate reductase assembly molybdenum cofactor insertion protein NarJ
MRTTVDDHRELLNEVAEWRLLSMLFDCPRNDWYGEVKALGKAVHDTTLKKAARNAVKEGSDSLFHSVFGPGGPAPGREVSYRGWVQPGYMLSEISAFYNAFSFSPDTQEPPDHVAVETGFIAYLKLKQLYALECEDIESFSIAKKASDDFIDEHLSKFTAQLAKILRVSGIEFLSLAGKALLDRVGPDKDNRLDRFLPVVESNEEEMSEFECGVT